MIPFFCGSFDSFNSQNQTRELEIKNLVMLYDFLNSKDCNYTSIIIDGAKINNDKGLYFTSDSFFNKISSCKDLEVLKISNCHLTTIPKQIYKLVKLKVLALDVNNIDSIPPEIKELKSLESLRMIYNKIRNLEFLNTEICELPCLKYLHFRNNFIENIPSKIELYKTLRILSLENNKIKSIPCSLSNLDNIEVDLYSSEYEIDSLPCCFNKPFKYFDLYAKIKNQNLHNCIDTFNINLKNGIAINGVRLRTRN
jgi:Leucine-rich repeat (LRR) protein